MITMKICDEANSDLFWRKVELSMMVRGFGSMEIPEFQVEPSLLNWTPHIGKHTRAQPQLLNTEHREVKKGSLKYEDDCREITEERLFELLNQSTAGEVKKFAKSLGCKTYGSKLDMILQLRCVISEDNSKFNKAFS